MLALVALVALAADPVPPPPPFSVAGGLGTARAPFFREGR